MFFRNLKWNIIGQRNYWFALSAAVIIAGAIALVQHHGLPLGLSFTGGSTIDVKFSRTVSEVDVRQALKSIDLSSIGQEFRSQYTALQVGDENLQLAQKAGDVAPNDRVLIETQSAINDPGPVYDALDRAGIKVDREQSQITSVGPSLSKEYLSRSLWALVIALVLQLLYIAFRFGNQLRYGIVADIALIHDVLVMVGIYAIANRKADDAFLAALLTVIGYSVMDSIVIFDRIRENGRVMPDVPYDQMVNTSLLQTMTRSVNTLLTVLITLFALLFFGGDTLKNFAFALLVGVTSGAYSSIFIASPLLVLWKNADNRKRAAVRAAVSSRELKLSAAAGATASGAPSVPTKLTPPKRKAPPPPPPRYKKKRPSPDAPVETATETASNPGGIIGLLAELRDDHGGDNPDEQLPGNS
ncbi:MAG TPA: protein translocase subunit SecF [Candidatus Eremiobacteraceae bacterium]|nr:protein translocase subunit SecF [Candidatus Eremiobacteraceae bacterium]